jgi:hypothetical protein
LAAGVREAAPVETWHALPLRCIEQRQQINSSGSPN